MASAIIIDVTEVKAAAKALSRIGQAQLQTATLRAVNNAAERGFETARKVILSGVNLTDDYIKKQMALEPATSSTKPQAQIIAFRAGGSRPGVRAINLRRFDPKQLDQITNWTNAGISTKGGGRIKVSDQSARSKFTLDRRGGAKLPWMKNPRKPGSKLPFIPRVGAPHLGLEIGRKQAGLTVEVVRGQRRELVHAFLAAGRKGVEAGGQGLLVFSRAKSDRRGKGRLKPIYSLSVWQMFRHVLPQVIPLVKKDLEDSIVSELGSQFQQVVNG
jgi:hypothetical protein